MQHYTITVGTKEYAINVEEVAPDSFQVLVDGQSFDVSLASSDTATIQKTGSMSALTAPMPGIIVSVDVSVDDRVQRGQPIITLEAMKMKNALLAPHDGVVAEVLARAGQRVDSGDVLVRFR